MKKETRTIESFQKIKMKDVGTLILSQGDREALTIEANEAILPELVSEVQQGTLILGYDDDWFNRIGKLISSVINGTNPKITYTLTVENLEKISLSGKCNIECSALKTDALIIQLSGWGNMAFEHLDCNTLDVNISGRGEFAAAGRADQQTIKISGSGDYEAPDLESRTLRLVISGQGNATVRVKESLDITISGLGQVNYYGHPELHQVISGMGKSKRLNEE